MVCGLKLCDELNESDASVDCGDGDFTDQMTEATLLRDGEAKAGAEEVAWYDKFEIYEEVTDETWPSGTGRKPISCRLKVINKGDNERVEVRSRLIAHEMKQKGTDSYFSGTPPLALVRFVISRRRKRKQGIDNNSWK